MTSANQVLRALQLACSQNPGELKIGENELSVWKKEKGFYSELAVSHRGNIIYENM